MIIAYIVNRRGNHYRSFVLFQFANMLAVIGLIISYGNETLFYSYFLLMAFTSFVQYRFKRLPFLLFTCLGLFFYVIFGSIRIDGMYEVVGNQDYWRWTNLLITSLLLAYQVFQLHQSYEQTISEAESREKQNETLFNETPIGIALLDLDHKKSSVRVNKGLTEILGISQEEALSTNLLSMSPRNQPNGKSSKKYLSEILSEYRIDRKSINFKWSFETKDSVLDTEIYLKPFPNSAPEPLDLMMLRDITATNEANRKLAEVQDLVDILFEISIDGVEYFVEDRGKDEVMAYRSNKNLREMLGLSHDELQNADISNISPAFQENGKDSAEYMKEVSDILKADGKVKYEWRFITENNESLDTEVTAVAKFIDNIYSYLAIFRDITEQKQAEKKINAQVQELNSKNEELEKYIESNMQLENFAYIASHDLKSPIRTIISFSQLLKSSLDDRLSDEEREYLKFIISGSKSMQRLIDALLTYAKIEFTEASIDDISPKTLLDDLLITLTSEIEDKGAKVSIANLPETIRADKTGLIQVFQNLILNGLKFTKTGTIPHLSISSREDDTHWVFSVKDNGIGIKKDYFEKIFLIFKKLNKQEDYEGTGIGLAVCQKIVQQHGGKIWLDSEYGEGTTFHFSIMKNQLHKQK